MSYPFAPTAQRTREVWLETVSKVGSKVTPGNVQEATILAFKPLNKISTTTAVLLSTSDDLSVSPIQMLLPNLRLCQLFAMGLGICHVPVDATGQTLWGNARFVSDPEDALFSAAEQAALRNIFNAKGTLKTGSTDRIDALHTSEFQISSVNAPRFTTKCRLLCAVYTMVGGEKTQFELQMPDNSDLSALNDTATRKLFLVVKGMVINIVPDTSATRDEIAAAMRGK